LRAEILPGGHVATDTRRVLRYFRLDAAGRFLFGSRGPFLSRQPQASDAKGHYAAVREIFPQLDAVTYEYAWGGKVAMTPDHLPHIHELAPGLYSALGCNGRGIAIATVMGNLVAKRALGASAEEIDYPTQPMKVLPLHSFNRFAVELVAQYYRFRDAWG
jgi:glycine/D-amino acid oxidase-like deaminating enzyme